MIFSLIGPGFTRFLLALIVFVHHVSRFNIGGAAVFCFFVLSGYWISLMWQTKYALAKNPYAVFLLSRFWRLFPVFILCSFLSVVVTFMVNKSNFITYLHSDFWHFLFSSIFILGYKSLGLMTNGPAWSLDIEMQFYLIAPILMYFALKFRAKYLIVLVVALISLLAALNGEVLTVLPYLVFFAIGTIIQLSAWIPKKEQALTALGLTTMVIAILLISPYRSILLGGATPSLLFKEFNLSLSVCLALIMVPYLIFTTKQKTSELDAMFGDLSFVVYLVHQPMLHLFNTGVGSGLQRLLNISAVFLGVMALSYLIWRYFDLPINRYRSKCVNQLIATSKP